MCRRRVVGVVQALCGLALALLPLLLLRRVGQHAAFGPVILDAPVTLTPTLTVTVTVTVTLTPTLSLSLTLNQAPPPADVHAATAAAAAPLRYEHVVWSSLGGACAAPEARGQR